MKTVTCTLDHESVALRAGTTILAAAESRGIFIPTLCHADDVPPEAFCSMCVVEIEGQSELVPACSTEVIEGMVIRTATERVKTARRTCIELLLSDHRGDCLGPCISACPAGIDIPGFIKHIALGEDRAAFELIAAVLPFAGSLGRICDRPCERVCRRQLVEEPVAICHLKRFAADQVLMSETGYQPEHSPPTGKRIAIVGAGPAGLSAAFFLLRQGHACTVFDRNQQPGGMLRYGIPSFRLPREMLDREIAAIERLGAEIRCGTTLGKDINLHDLQNRYDAVVIALGAQKPLMLGLPEETAAGVMTALAFLRAYGSGAAAHVGSRVIVIGGGGAAIDAARVARRNGEPQVHIYCLEKNDAMPAPLHEQEAARAEGIVIHNELGVQRLIVKNGRIQGIDFKRCISTLDVHGKFNPRYSASETTADVCETLIIATGQQPELSCLEGTSDMYARITAQAPHSPCRLLHVRQQSMQTRLQKIFASGDCVTGSGTAVQAVAAGRKAAVAIDQFLKGKTVTGEQQTYQHSMGLPQAVPEKVFRGCPPAARVIMPQIAAGSRLNSFHEVETGFTDAVARAEARRCIECGCAGATECRLRRYAELYDADGRRYEGACREYDRIEAPPEIIYDVHRCIQCRTCIRIAEAVFGTPFMQVMDRGFSTRIMPVQEKLAGMLPGSSLMRIVENCPTRALSFKKNFPQPAGPASETWMSGG
ncbi:MAG: FAD-dependent oxidoreductase [Deltaproteobacteria bacterium]|nr:FAD-dependent oxidoreductase [Deltaproteobacteria bacterium]